MQPEKIAPVQGYTPGIPWEMHLRAYDAYRKRYGAQQALIDLEGRNCRGGFHIDELDEFIPGWREALSERKRMLDRIAALEATMRPFAEAYAFWSAMDGGVADSGEIDDQGKLTFGHLRAAAEVMSSPYAA